jgi:hypothetical protein
MTIENQICIPSGSFVVLAINLQFAEHDPAT